MDDKIYGGAFTIARQLFQSEVWMKKPSSWKVIWVYILGKVNHADSKVFKRGEGFFNFEEERRKIGIDITPDMIKKAITYFRKSGKISTTRSTRGTIVKVLKYNHFQDFAKYSSTLQSTTEAREKHERSTPINNNDKNDKNEKKKLLVCFEKIWSKYPNKDGKKQAQRHFLNSIKNKEDWNNINKAIDNYLTCKQVKSGYIKNGSTWFNNWQDWIDYKNPENITDELTETRKAFGLIKE